MPAPGELATLEAFVNADDEREPAFREALRALLSDAAERARLRAAGLARAAGFTWEATARGVDAVMMRLT